jgi:C-terminal processing protease CtpA/Prc
LRSSCTCVGSRRRAAAEREHRYHRPRLKQLALSFVLASTLAACSSLISRPATHADVPPKEFGATFTPAELREDLRFLVRVCEEVHPRPHAVASEEEIAALEGELDAEIDHPLTRVEFWPIAARLAAAYGDAHTSVQGPSEEWNAFVAGGGKLLPIAIEQRGEKLSIAQTAWLAGCELVSVGGIDLGALWREYRAERAGEEPFVFATFNNNLNWHLWRVGVRAPFVLDVVRDGARARCEIAGIDASQLTRSQARAAALANWSFVWLPDDVALIDFRSMSDTGAWNAFLRATFTEIRNRPACGVIVDLRRNGGGDSSLAEALLDYLTDRPYRMCARKEWRSSARYRRYMKEHVVWWLRWLPIQYLHPFGRAFWGVDEGALYVDEGEMTTAKPNPLRFTGPWCLLIGPSTFSSAVMLANGVGDFELAPIFGAPSGGVPTESGEVYSCDLPHSRLSFGVSSAYFVRANGDANDPRPVLPTHPCAQSAADSAAGRDTVLESARAWVLEQSRGERAAAVSTSSAR